MSCYGVSNPSLGVNLFPVIDTVVSESPNTNKSYLECDKCGEDI